MSPKPSPCRLAAAALAAWLAAAVAGAAAAGDTPAVRLRLVDRPVVDHEGRRLSFARELLGGGPVVINTVFSTCGTLCPLTSAVMQGLQEELAARGRDDVRLVSLTLDPVADGVEALSEMARAHAAGPRWRFVGGEPGDVLVILDGLRAAPGDLAAHPPLFLVGDAASGEFRRVEGLPEPGALLALVEEVRR